MIQFKHDSIMKRHDVLVPSSLAGVQSTVIVAHIDEEVESSITVYRELTITLLRQILMAWDEQEHMIRMKEEREKIKEEREAGEFDRYFDEEDDKPTFH